MRTRTQRRKGKDKYTRDLEAFIPQYVEATGDENWTMTKVATWAIQNNLWEQRQSSAVRQLAGELSRVARQATFTDENGREVRKYHSFKLGQQTFWADIHKIKRDQMDESKTMRREKLVRGAIRLTIDLEHYNEKCNPGDPLLFDPDLSMDIEDFFHPPVYDDTPPEELPEG